MLFGRPNCQSGARVSRVTPLEPPGSLRQLLPKVVDFLDVLFRGFLFNMVSSRETSILNDSFKPFPTSIEPRRLCTWVSSFVARMRNKVAVVFSAFISHSNTRAPFFIRSVDNPPHSFLDEDQFRSGLPGLLEFWVGMSLLGE